MAGSDEGRHRQGRAEPRTPSGPRRACKQAIANFSELAEMEARVAQQGLEGPAGPLPGEPGQPAEAAASRSEPAPGRTLIGPSEETTMATKIPRSKENDYTARDGRGAPRASCTERTGAALDHVGSFSFDPRCCPATSRTSWASRRCRSASPDRCASTASTPRASSTSRWRRPRARWSPATTAACACSPSAAASRRRSSTQLHAALAGVHLRRRAAGARVRRLGRASTSTTIKAAAETTTRSGKLINIGQYSIGPLRYLRFNYTTGDAAGQNMTGKATLRRLRVDQEATIPGGAQLHPVGQHRHRQEALAHQHAADPRQARRRRGDDQATTCSRA